MKQMKIKLNKDNIALVYLFLASILTNFVQIHFNTDKPILVIWSICIIIMFIFYPTIKIHQITNIQKLWIILQFYTILSTIFNYLIGTSRSYGLRDLSIACLISYILPCIAAMNISGKQQLVFWAHLYNRFILLCSILGIIELVTKTQLYSFLITSKLAMFNQLTYSNPISNNYRLTLFFYHPTYYSILLSIGLITLLFFPFKNRILSIITVIIIFINLVYTQSRTGWIAAILGVLLFYLTKRINKKNIIKLVTTSCILIVFILFLICNKKYYNSILFIISQRILEALEGNGFGARLANISIINNIFHSNEAYIFLFGGGEKFAITYLQNYTFIDSWDKAIDNQFITLLLNFGIIGIGLYISLLILAIKGFVKTRKDFQNPLPYVLIIMYIAISFLFEPLGANILGTIFNLIIFIIPTLKSKNSNDIQINMENYR